MSPSISRQQLGNRKRGTRMKRNFLADEEELTKKKKIRKRAKREEFISSEDIIHQFANQVPSLTSRTVDENTIQIQDSLERLSNGTL